MMMMTMIFMILMLIMLIMVMIIIIMRRILAERHLSSWTDASGFTFITFKYICNRLKAKTLSSVELPLCPSSTVSS